MGFSGSRETTGVGISAQEDQGLSIPEGWGSVLREQIDLLKNLTGNTEEEFLSLGAKFHGFYGKSAEIVASVQNMVAEISGERSSATSAELQTLLGRMESFLSGSEEETARISDAFNHILSLFDAAEEPLGNFKKINKILRMLGTATKIESARMGTAAAGFETLANDVAEMSVQVVEKALNVLKQKHELTTTLRSALQQVSGAGAVQSSHVRDTLQRVRDDIQRMDAVKSRCSAAVELINRMSREMSDGISNVVMSMQSHDITRQQIEHVHESLSEVLEHCEVGGNGTPAVIQEAGDICELQAAQLEYAADEFYGAVDSIIANLRHLAEEASGMAGEIGGLMGVADEAGSSFLTEMERELVFVNTTLADSARVNQEMSLVMEQVSAKVGEIGLFVNEISGIGIEIELIAMNAQIKSARVGVDGAALGVLAEAIQRLSTETGELTEATSAILLQITTATAQLCEGVDEDTSQQLQDVQSMVSEIEILMQNLHQVNGVLGGTSAGMQRLVNDLADGIGEAVAGISVHETIRQVSIGVANALNGIVTEAQSLIPSAISGTGGERLKRLADRYTMQSERLVHARIAGGVTAGSFGVTDSTMAGAGEDDGLGDNVELF